MSVKVYTNNGKKIGVTSLELNPINAKNFARKLKLDALIVDNGKYVHLIVEKKIGPFYAAYTRGKSQPVNYDIEGNVTQYNSISKGLHKFWKRRNKYKDYLI